MRRFEDSQPTFDAQEGDDPLFLVPLCSRLPSQHHVSSIPHRTKRDSGRHVLLSLKSPTSIMPTISTGDKVLVTGANGFIAAWVVRRFLEKGYAVRGTVRSADKGKHLQESFKSYGDKFEIAVVHDITKEGAFDEAVKGVDGIAHTASPFYLDAASVDELIGPAVNGTLSILKSAAKHGQSVKRIVVTSSCASVLEVGKDKVFTEEDWNELSIREVKEQGDKAPGPSKYRASKTLAEKAAWEFYEQNKSNIKWDLSVLNPPFVFGPAIHGVNDIASLNTSARQWYDTVLVEGKPKDFLTTQGSAWIDVRDVAEAHVLALEKEEAGGERIIISAGSYVWQDWIDAANSLSPSPIPSHTPLPVGYPGAGRTAKAPVAYDTAKAAKILGLKYRSMEEMTRDVLADFEKRGW
ncbi:D-lactaldehyde dehydrogenase [Lyophyllum atratum]|nr:D-lactaldehyde dehydrogenase [Lyophyllum atratum]